MESLSTYVHSIDRGYLAGGAMWIYLFNFENMTAEAEEWSDPFEMEEHSYALRRFSATAWQLQLASSSRLGVPYQLTAKSREWVDVPTTAVSAIEAQ
ncbi:MAG TPA: hypothetical protein VHP33_07775, partial [Polyangiaceae bacterium]|nr:hypothetical protein [Polyangiaceae bacterium]